MSRATDMQLLFFWRLRPPTDIALVAGPHWEFHGQDEISHTLLHLASTRLLDSWCRKHAWLHKVQTLSYSECTGAKLAVGPTSDGKTVIGLFRKGHSCRAATFECGTNTYACHLLLAKEIMYNFASVSLDSTHGTRVTWCDMVWRCRKVFCGGTFEVARHTDDSGSYRVVSLLSFSCDHFCGAFLLQVSRLSSKSSHARIVAKREFWRRRRRREIGHPQTQSHFYK